jgi:hypothetical protein
VVPLFAAGPQYVEAARMFLTAVGNAWLATPGARSSEPPGSLGGLAAFRAASCADHLGGGPEQRTGGLFRISVFARDGGLLSCGPDLVDNWRRAATYVGRIVRGEKPGDLPVQFPTKFGMVVTRPRRHSALPRPHR